MRIFLAGATGVIGKPLTAKLLARGHSVVGLTRSPDRARALDAMHGVRGVVGDCLDRESLKRLLEESRPDAVIHQTTSIPKKIHPRKIASQLAETNRLRIEGTAYLMEAAVEAGAGRFLAQSIAFGYRPGPGGLRTETDPLYTERSGPTGSVTRAIESLENTVLGEARLEGIVLRYGFFYGPGTVYAGDGSATAHVRRRAFPIIGDGSGVFSFVNVGEAADATVIAIEKAHGGVYNIVDDDPAPVRDWLPFFAATVGAPPPRRVPLWLGRLVGGPYAAYLMTAMPGASNRKAREQLGWTPTGWRPGFERAHLMDWPQED